MPITKFTHDVHHRLMSLKQMSMNIPYVEYCKVRDTVDHRIVDLGHDLVLNHGLDLFVAQLPAECEAIVFDYLRRSNDYAISEAIRPLEMKYEVKLEEAELQADQ